MSWLPVLMAPLSFVFGLTISSLSYLLSSLLFIASPVIYLGQGVLYLALLPLRILIKLTAFIYFMAGAVLAGATVGVILHFTGNSISLGLNIAGSDETPPRDTRLRTIHSKPEDPPCDYLETEDTKDIPCSTIVEEEESSHESE